MSADTIVPGSASGSMDGVQLRPLTVDFHEPGFVGQIAGENSQSFWFQMSDDERGKAGSPWGPANPQALNRYSYVQNRPLGATDPTGHAVPCKEKDCRTRVDVSSWPEALKKVVAFGCVLFGCEINDSTLIGSSPENIVSEAMPIGMVGGAFKHAWIKRELFGELKQLVGEADLKKFVAALDKGVVGSYGESGIKILREPVNGYTHELKIGGSAQRLLGKINDAGILVFDRFIRGGLH